MHNIRVCMLTANNMLMKSLLPAEFYVLLSRSSGNCALYLSYYYCQSAVVVKIFGFWWFMSLWLQTSVIVLWLGCWQNGGRCGRARARPTGDYQMDVVGHHDAIPDFCLWKMICHFVYCWLHDMSYICRNHFPTSYLSEIMYLLVATDRNEEYSFIIVMPFGPELVSVSHVRASFGVRPCHGGRFPISGQYAILSVL